MSDGLKAPRTSVVIATYNRPESLRRLLTQLALQTMESSDFEVVVVDDGSRTSLPEISVPTGSELSGRRTKAPPRRAITPRKRPSAMS